jgi:hypothetical protein
MQTVHVSVADSVIANAINARTGYSITAEQWDNWQSGEDDPQVEAAVKALLGGWELDPNEDNIVGAVLAELGLQIKF